MATGHRRQFHFDHRYSFAGCGHCRPCPDGKVKRAPRLDSPMVAMFKLPAMDSSSVNVGLAVQGMTCASCVNRVERALSRVPGVLSATVNLATERADVVRQAGQAPTAELLQALQKAGYSGRDLSADDPAPADAALGEGARVALAALLSLPWCCRWWATCSAATGCSTAGGSSRWRRRCSSGSARASMAPASRRCARAAATWIC
jgi:copper chaperone CopZ